MRGPPRPGSPRLARAHGRAHPTNHLPSTPSLRRWCPRSSLPCRGTLACTIWARKGQSAVQCWRRRRTEWELTSLLTLLLSLVYVSPSVLCSFWKKLGQSAGLWLLRLSCVCVYADSSDCCREANVCDGRGQRRGPHRRPQPNPRTRFKTGGVRRRSDTGKRRRIQPGKCKPRLQWHNPPRRGRKDPKLTAPFRRDEHSTGSET